MEEKRPFAFYEFLRYAWKKKILLLAIPIIVMLLAIGAVSLLRNVPAYTAESTVFVGSLSEKSLTDPDNIKARYDVINKNVDVYVSEKGIVKMVLKDDKEAKAKEDLKKITNEFYSELEKQYTLRLDASNEKLEHYEKHVAKLSEELDQYKKQLTDQSLTVTETDELTQLIIDTEQRLSDEQKEIHKMKSDLIFFEKPSILTSDIHKSKSYIKEAAIIGLLLGLVFSVLALMLMKYVSDARKYYSK